MPLPRLLFLTHRFVYPPNRGDRIRSYNLLRVLQQQYRVTLGCTTDEPITAADQAHVRELCESVHIAALQPYKRYTQAALSVLRGKSLTAGMFHSKALSETIVRLQRTAPFDVVLVFCSSMFPYIDNESFASTRVIVDLVDVDSEKWQQLSRQSTLMKRPIYALEANRVRKLEHRIAERADAIALVSEKEADLYRSVVQTNGTPVVGISNGVDTDYFRPLAPSPLATRHSPLATLSLIFTGVLDYPPNVEGIIWFCRQVLPALNAASPSSEPASPQTSVVPLPLSPSPPLPLSLTIVGRRPNQRVRELDKLPGVNLVGEVPDVRPYLHQADIAISPLKLARGIQNKVLEAMACGLPVIATSESAEGIDAQPGQQIVIADTSQQWVRAIEEFGNNGSQRKEIGRQARDYVVRQFSWPTRLRQFDTLLQQHIQRSSSS